MAGFKGQIDELPWIATGVRHTLDRSGYVSQLKLETEQADDVQRQAHGPGRGRI